MTVMNADERERFLATMREDEAFRAAVRRELLTDELLDLPSVVANLAATVHTLVDVAAEQRRDLTEVKQDLTEVKQDLTEVKQDLTEVKQSIADYMAQTMAILDAFRSAMVDGFTAVRSEVASLRVDMDTGFTAVAAKFEQVDAALAEIRDQLAS